MYMYLKFEVILELGSQGSCHLLPCISITRRFVGKERGFYYLNLTGAGSILALSQPLLQSTENQPPPGPASVCRHLAPSYLSFLVPWQLHEWVSIFEHALSLSFSFSHKSVGSWVTIIPQLSLSLRVWGALSDHSRWSCRESSICGTPVPEAACAPGAEELPWPVPPSRQDSGQPRGSPGLMRCAAQGHSTPGAGTQ